MSVQLLLELESSILSWDGDPLRYELLRVVAHADVAT